MGPASGNRPAAGACFSSRARGGVKFTSGTLLPTKDNPRPRRSSSLLRKKPSNFLVDAPTALVIYLCLYGPRGPIPATLRNEESFTGEVTCAVSPLIEPAWCPKGPRSERIFEPLLSSASVPPSGIAFEIGWPSSRTVESVACACLRIVHLRPPFDAANHGPHAAFCATAEVRNRYSRDTRQYGRQIERGRVNICSPEVFLDAYYNPGVRG